MSRIAIAAFIVLTCITGARASEPSPGPFLAPMGDLPEEAISAVAAIPEEGLLITASWDSSLRFWDLMEGTALGRILLPVSLGEEGRLQSVTVQPGGNLVAVGGYSAVGSTEGYTLFLVDKKSRSISRTLPDLPGPIHGLAFSPDGSLLAIAMGSSQALLIIKVDGLGTVFAPNLGDTGGTTLAWSDDGRLALGLGDGTIHGFSQDGGTFKETAVSKPWVGKERTPYRLAWSPDGSRIAVSYGIAPFIEILGSADLERLVQVDVQGIRQEVYSVAFSPKGDRLFAGGRYNRGRTIIRVWESGGSGSYRDLETSTNTIFDLEPLPDGSLVFGAADPAWGRIDTALKVIPVRFSARLDLRDGANQLSVNEDGTLVRFQPLPGPFFSLDEMGYTDGGDAPYAAVLPHGAGDSFIPEEDSLTWNGMRLRVPGGDVALRIAEVSGGKGLLVGSTSHLSMFASEGEVAWSVPVPYVLGLTVSGNGEVAVASLGDGTIRWYCLAAGRELLALLPSKDGSSWLLWNPKGAYAVDGSFGSRFGWITQEGSGSPGNFHQAAEYESRFHRPADVLSLLWSCEGLDRKGFVLSLICYLIVLGLLALLYLLAIPGYALGWFGRLGELAGFEGRKAEFLRAGWLNWITSGSLLALPFLAIPLLLQGHALARWIGFSLFSPYFVLHSLHAIGTWIRVLLWVVPILVAALFASMNYRLLGLLRRTGEENDEGAERRHVLEIDEKARDRLMRF